MICKICGVKMKSGVTFDNKDNKSRQRLYTECPRCHTRLTSKNCNFEDVLDVLLKKKY